MFKNANPFRLPPHWEADLESAEAALQESSFVPCAPSQAQSIGWVPPRETNGAMIESVGGQWIAKLLIETKAVPGEVVKRRVAEKVAKVEEEQGRRAGKKEKREMKEDALLELLPMAFSKQSAVLVWINPVDRLLVIDASSGSKTDTTLTALARTLPQFGALAIQTVNSTTRVMCDWLRDGEPPENFQIARECELEAQDESKASVKYARHSLDNGEVVQHIAHGKVPTKLAMIWGGRVSFLMSEEMVIRRIEILDVVTDGIGPAEDAFDGNVAIATGELRKLIPELIEALGGEIELQPELALEGGSTESTASDDELYVKAIELVRTNSKASISLVQRHLKIGYNRAARLLEEMEAKEVVSPMKSNGSREVLK